MFSAPKLCRVYGGGFGLYGYMPAAAMIGYRVVMDPMYEKRLVTRNELVRYGNQITFSLEDKATPDVIVIARRPEDQERMLNSINTICAKERIVLEKPLCINPSRARKALKMIVDNGLANMISTGYTFIFTEWGEEVEKMLLSDKVASIDIIWKFKAHHFEKNNDTWKKHHSVGGGALRFYGIQLIGLLSVANKWVIDRSEISLKDEDTVTIWKCRLHNNNHTVNIYLDCNCNLTHFSCCVNGVSVYEDIGPFCTLTGSDQDCRVTILTNIILGDERCNFKRLEESILLWEKIEEYTCEK